MSSTSKGRAFENFVANQMEQMGWHIAFKSIRVRYGAIDFDGKWDIIGLKRLNPEQVQWMFVQCKSRKMYGKEKESLRIWKKVYGFAGIICMVAYKKKVKGKVTVVWDEI